MFGLTIYDDKVELVSRTLSLFLMGVYSIFVISDSGSLQTCYDRTPSSPKVEKTFSYPLPIKFEKLDGRVCVDFGATDSIKLGYSILEINGVEANGTCLVDGRDIMEVCKTNVVDLL